MDETQELTTIAPAQTPTVQQSEPQNMMQLIAALAKDPNSDVEKFRALLDIKLTLEDRDAKAAFYRDKSLLQADLPLIKKNGVILNKQGQVASRFSKFEDISRIIKPLLVAHGFSTGYTTEREDTKMKVILRLSHVQGHSEDTAVYVPLLDQSGFKNDVQGSGSVISYGKRYALKAALDIVEEGEDDDGQMGMGDPISEEEAGDMKATLEERGANVKAFLDLMGVKDFKQITKANVEQAWRFINAKAKR